ncbi:MAG: hypothetical protein C0458_04235, partial [Methylobacterium sp.]|nr:hypothetical protein [Methylobacterium sp.]
MPIPFVCGRLCAAMPVEEQRHGRRPILADLAAASDVSFQRTTLARDLGALPVGLVPCQRDGARYRRHRQAHGQCQGRLVDLRRLLAAAVTPGGGLDCLRQVSLQIRPDERTVFRRSFVPRQPRGAHQEATREQAELLVLIPIGRGRAGGCYQFDDTRARAG